VQLVYSSAATQPTASVQRTFFSTVQPAAAEVAVIYYAGHGIELDGTNYLTIGSVSIFVFFEVPLTRRANQEHQTRAQWGQEDADLTRLRIFRRDGIARIAAPMCD